MNCTHGDGNEISIDGLQLMFPGTGLALVTAEWIRGIHQMKPLAPLTVYIPDIVDLREYDLPERGIDWMRIAKPTAHTDYLFRFVWGRSVVACKKKRRWSGSHLIPYLYNYGRLRANVVLIPDLVYRLFPDYGGHDPKLPGLRLRGRLPFRPIARRLEEWAASQAQRLIVYSRFVRDHAADVFRISVERFTEVALAAPRWITVARQLTEKSGVDPHSLPERFVLYVGGYAGRKNVPMLLRACGRVYERDASFRCVYAGLGEDRIESEAALAHALNALSVRRATIRVPRVANYEIKGMYDRCSFSIYPSHAEGFGLPLVEAGMRARLCLCGDNSSMREIQRNPRFRINSDSEDEWVSRILHYWQHPLESEAAGRECKTMASRYSWEASTRKLLEVLLPRGEQC